MKRLAVKKFMAPYEPAMSPDEVVSRKVVDDIRHRLSSWRQKSDATIVSGRYKSGKTVAVEEALRCLWCVGLHGRAGRLEACHVPNAWSEGREHVCRGMSSDSRYAATAHVPRLIVNP